MYWFRNTAYYNEVATDMYIVRTYLLELQNDEQ